MSLHHNPKIVTDGLVFAYDMDNVAKSWKGKPTTNIITITDLDAGWSQGYNTSIQWNDYKPPHGVNSQVVSFIDADGNGSGYWYSYGDYAPQQPSTTYTISVYARTIGSDWSIRAYTADNSEVGRQYTNTLTVPGDGKWHRLEFNSITTPSNTESDSLSFQFTTIPAGQRCWLCAPQMEEGTFATPFVDGTRSNTQALLDMSKSKNTVTASSLTYNSDGTFEFDNSNPDEITVPHSSIGHPTASYTSEAWVWADSSQDNLFPRIWDKSQILVHITQTSPFTIAQNTSTTGGTRQVIVGSAFTHSTWTHIVTSYDGQVGKIYVNGSLISTNDFGSILNPSTSTTVLTIGGNTGTTRQFNGKIDKVKLYWDKVLTAAEIKQNFNATRGRFGI